MNDATLELESSSPEQTQEIASELGRMLHGGEFIGLEGPLGAGKTEFVRGLAAGLGFEDAVSSPTYVIEHVYDKKSLEGGIQLLHHWDMYRLGNTEPENELLDYREDESCVVVIEWPEKLAWVSRLLSMGIAISCPDLSKSELRRLCFSAYNARAESLLSEFKARVFV